MSNCVHGLTVTGDKCPICATPTISNAANKQQQITTQDIIERLELSWESSGWASQRVAMAQALATARLALAAERLVELLTPVAAAPVVQQPGARPAQDILLLQKDCLHLGSKVVVNNKTFCRQCGLQIVG